MKHLKRLNTKGFAHWIMPVVAIVIIGGIGSYLLTKSHAASLPYVVVSNTGSGARANINVLLGQTKSTGTDVNKITSHGNVNVTFCGYPNSTYTGYNIYKYSSTTGRYYQMGGAKTYRVSSTSTKTCSTVQLSTTSVGLCGTSRVTKVKFTSIASTNTYVASCTLNSTSTKVTNP